MGEVDERLLLLFAETQRGREKLVKEQHLRGNHGGGTSGGVTDDWKSSVDGQLKQLHDDVRRLTGWIIAAVAGPLLAIIGLYAYTGAKFDAAETRVVGVERRLAAIEVEQAKISGKLDLILERKPVSVGAR